MSSYPTDWPALVARYNEINHYGKANGMVLTVSAPGQAEYRMTIGEAHLSSPGTAHGGVLAGLLDAVLGAAALTQAFTAGELVSTIEFKINYLRPAMLGDELRAVAQVEHAGKSIIVVSGIIYRTAGTGPEQAVAQGLGTFNRYPATKRQLEKKEGVGRPRLYPLTRPPYPLLLLECDGATAQPQLTALRCWARSRRPHRRSD